MKTVYVDHAATTPVLPEAVAAMCDLMNNHYGNPSSLHAMGVEAHAALEKARGQVAALINAPKEQIYFTSGGTEADNLAILGTARAAGHGHIITTAVEHHAVLDSCRYLEKHGFELTILPVNEEGLITAKQVEEALREDTILVTVMHANNEVGSVNPVEEIGRLLRNHKAVFHVDAVQSVGKISVDVQAIDCDMLTYSSHKINGPKGVGVLYRRGGFEVESLVYGGGQEHKFRSGTENLPGIVGFGVAAERTLADWQEQAAGWLAMRRHFIERVQKEIPAVKINGSLASRLPHNINVSFAYIEGESLLLYLDMAGICCSSGSACTSGEASASHVLTAMHITEPYLNSAVRITLGRGNTMEDIDYIVEVLKQKVKMLRMASPFAPKDLYEGYAKKA